MRLLAVMCALCCLLASGPAAPAGATEGASHGGGDGASRVVLVLAPYLSWDDVTGGEAPTLEALAAEGAIGNINLKNRSQLARADSSAQGALTFSAGSWAAADPAAPCAYSTTEYYEGGTSAEAFERMTGVSAEGFSAVFLGLPRTWRLNDSGASLDVVLGTIGETIEQAGGATAAVGTSDSGYEVRGLWRSRPAALVAMDADGRVRFGDVSTDLLVNDPASPYGFRTDMDALGAVVREVEGELDAHGGPQFVVVDPGDLERAREFAPEVMPEVAEEHHAAAVRGLDEVVSLVVETLPEDGVLIVAPHAIGRASPGPAGLGPIIVSGPGWSGHLTSSSTQRTGLVTNLDMAATVLAELGLDRPTQVLGNRMVAQPDEGGFETRVAGLGAVNATAIAVDSAKPPILNGYIAVTTIALLLATVVLLRAGRWERSTVRVVTAVFRAVFLLALAVPPATILMFAIDPLPATAAEATALFALTTTLLWVAALLLVRFAPLRIPVAFLSLTAAGVLMVDQWLGAPLSFSSFLGYSPLLGARYYGLGNEGAALLMGALIVGLAYLFDQYPDSPTTQAARRWGLPVAGAVMVVTSAAPFWGANVAVAAWGVVGFAVAWALMNGYRFSWKLVAVMLFVIVAALAVFSAIDLGAGDGTQTHLGRAWASAASGGFGELWLIVVRKAETNLRVLTRTNWSYLLVAVLAFLGFMRWRPQGDFAATLEENTSFSAAVAGSLIGGVAAYITEDSGIVIPALIMLYVGVGILYLMLSRSPVSHPGAVRAGSVGVSAKRYGRDEDGAGDVHS